MILYRVQYRVVKYEYYTAYVRAKDSDEARHKVWYGDVENEKLIYDNYEDPDNIELFIAQDNDDETEMRKARLIQL